MVCGMALYAQYPTQYQSFIPLEFNYTENFSQRSGNLLTVNYDQNDEAVFGVNYRRALFPLHRKYASLTGQNLVYALYSLDSLIKTDNSYSVKFSDLAGLTLDSISIRLGHVKHSGGNDTLILSLISLTTGNFPGGSLLYSDTLVISSSLSPAGILTNTNTFTWSPGYLLDDQPVGLKIEFTGSVQDTLALLGGYGIYPAPNTCTDDSLDKARKSNFYANSYAYWSNYNLILPTAVGGDLFYNCDSLITKDTSDSESYIQNWAVTSYVSAPEIGIEQENDELLTIYPNPSGNIVYVKSVDPVDGIRIYNGSGALVKTLQSQAFVDVTDLNNGIYIFALDYENKTVRKKVVVLR